MISAFRNLSRKELFCGLLIILYRMSSEVKYVYDKFEKIDATAPEEARYSWAEVSKYPNRRKSACFCLYDVDASFPLHTGIVHGAQNCSPPITTRIGGTKARGFPVAGGKKKTEIVS